MNGWLVFFAFPISTIILSITAQKLIKSPILVGSIFFSVYLIVAFAVFDAFFIIYAFAYAIFAYITAIMTQMITQFIESNKKLNNISSNAGNISSYNGYCNNIIQNENGGRLNTGTTTNIRVRVLPRNNCYNNTKRSYR